MDPRTLLTALSRRKMTIAVTTALAMLLAGIGSLFIADRYDATVTLRLRTAAGGSLAAVDYNVNYADRLMNTYAEIAETSPLIESIAASVGFAEPPEVKSNIRANTELMELTVSVEDPERGAAFINELALQLSEQASQVTSRDDVTQNALLEQLSELDRTVAEARATVASVSLLFRADSPEVQRAVSELNDAEDRYSNLLLQVRTREAIQATSLSVVEPAEVPDEPSVLSLTMLLALGFLGGAMAGTALAIVEENLDLTVRSETDLSKLGGGSLAVLGVIPELRRGRNGSLRPSATLLARPRALRPGGSADEVETADDEAQQSTDGKLSPRAGGRAKVPSPESDFDQSFRRLRAAIDVADVGFDIKSFLVVSVEQGAGKSTIVSNLARSFAMTGLRVVVVDCSLYAPAQATMFGVDPSIGLSQLTDSNWESLVQRTAFDGLDVLAAGGGEVPGFDLLGSVSMEMLVKWLGKEYDVVLLDSPSLEASGDAAVLTPLADALLLVVGLGSSRRDAIERVLTQLSPVRANVLGLIANRG